LARWLVEADWRCPSRAMTRERLPQQARSTERRHGDGENLVHGDFRLEYRLSPETFG
jgi:hypothetical protein